MPAGTAKGSKPKYQPKTKPKETRSSGLWSVLLSSLVTAAILLVGYKYFSEHQSMDRTVLSVHPVGVLLPGGKIPAFGMNVAWLNKGPLEVDGVLCHFDFEFPNRILTPAEEDAYINAISNFSPLEAATSTLGAGDAAWITFYDNKGEMRDWSKVTEFGSMYVYLFAVFRYTVDGAVKQTEFCVYITKDWPSIHNCLGHNNKTTYK